LTEQTLRLREASLGLLKLKYDNGVLNELDWRSAQSLVEAARVSRAQWQRQWQLDLKALSLLVGQGVGSEQWPPMPVVPQRPVDDVEAIVALGSDASALWPRLSELPVGLPSEVLLKRPDITQAEQQLISANANIGAARAARFPRISLTGSGGVASDSLSGLFSDGRSAWSVGGSLLAPILDAGRTQAGVTVAEVRRDIAMAQYDKALQVAFREVADALVTRSTYADQVRAQQAQASAEADRLRLSALRYKSGVASQLDLLDAQRSLFAAQQAWISTEQARQQAHIAVFKALGGGLR
jgi:multidrug efflux system outer membrane protein